MTAARAAAEDDERDDAAGDAVAEVLELLECVYGIASGDHGDD
jgi:hypothetical protein